MFAIILIGLFRYVKLLVQEFNIHIDKGFLMSLYDIYSATQVKQQEVKEIDDRSSAFSNF
jgi:hypothetical protein